MSRTARILCWIAIVGAIAGPYARHVASSGLQFDRVPRVPLISAAGWVALPIALVGAVVAIRRRVWRRLRFVRPSARTADLSLVVFAVFAVADRFTSISWLLGLPLRWSWSGEFQTSVPLLAVLLGWRLLGRCEMEDAWGLGLGRRPGHEVIAGSLVAAWLGLEMLLLGAGWFDTIDGGWFRYKLVDRMIQLVVVAPVAEEVIFRGILYTTLRRSRGPLASALVVGVLFAMMHQGGHAWAIASHFAFGFVLGLVREWRGSLLPCVVAHAVGNALIGIPYLVYMWGLPSLLPEWFT